MSNPPSISIIIPVYQVAEYIVACLASVAGQAYDGHVEVIIVDDCGTDNSMALARSFVDDYCGPFTFSFYSHTHNRGLSAARNTGMKYATGDYLLFVDSDDELLPDALNHLTEPLRSEVYDVVVGRTIKSDHSIHFTPAYSTLHGPAIYHEYAEKRLPVEVWNKLFRRAMINNNAVSFCEGIICEDVLFGFQIFHIAKSLYVIDETTYFYRIRNGSITMTFNFEKSVNSSRRIIKEMMAYSEKFNLSKSRDVAREIEHHRMWLLNRFRFNLNKFISEYLELRQSNPLAWTDYFKMELIHPIKQLRLFHYALPPRCGAWYLYLWIRWTRR